MRLMSWILLGSLVALTACGPSEQTKAEVAEKKRIECLDKFCEGDVEPKRDWATEVVFKLNGQWYVGPKEYGNPNLGAMSFYWPSRVARGDALAASKANEIRKSEVGSVDNFYDIAIEIFLNTPKMNPPGKTLYQTLLEMESKGLVLEKLTPRPGLEVWRTKEEGLLLETWYVAAALKEPSGDPPTIACRESAPEHARCSTGFRWQPDVAASMRFRAAHGPEWPEIYQETERVLQLFKRV